MWNAISGCFSFSWSRFHWEVLSAQSYPEFDKIQQKLPYNELPTLFFFTILMTVVEQKKIKISQKQLKINNIVKQKGNISPTVQTQCSNHITHGFDEKPFIQVNLLQVITARGYFSRVITYIIKAAILCRCDRTKSHWTPWDLLLSRHAQDCT